MITAYHQEFLSGTHSFWLASANNKRIPDAIRCNGIMVENETTLRCFFSEKFSGNLRENIAMNSSVSLLVTHLYSFIGYQYKGKLLEIFPSTDEEVKHQLNYIEDFGNLMPTIGLSRDLTMGRLYDTQATYTALIEIEKIFEQAPKDDTGREVHL